MLTRKRARESEADRPGKRARATEADRPGKRPARNRVLLCTGPDAASKSVLRQAYGWMEIGVEQLESGEWAYYAQKRKRRVRLVDEAHCLRFDQRWTLGDLSMLHNVREMILDDTSLLAAYRAPRKLAELWATGTHGFLEQAIAGLPESVKIIRAYLTALAPPEFSEQLSSSLAGLGGLQFLHVEAPTPGVWTGEVVVPARVRALGTCYVSIAFGPGILCLVDLVCGGCVEGPLGPAFDSWDRLVNLTHVSLNQGAGRWLARVPAVRWAAMPASAVSYAVVMPALREAICLHFSGDQGRDLQRNQDLLAWTAARTANSGVFQDFLMFVSGYEHHSTSQAKGRSLAHHRADHLRRLSLRALVVERVINRQGTATVARALGRLPQHIRDEIAAETLAACP